MKGKGIVIFLIILIILASGLLGYLVITDSDINKIMGSKKNDVEKTLNSLTLEEKIGQMLIISYRSGDVDNTLKNALYNNKPGGFILFSENFTRYDNTISLIKTIKESSKIPLFLAVDQEGGSVQRLNAIKGTEVTTIPEMFKLGETKDKDLAYQVGEVMAEELKVFGINMDFAPVLDIVKDKNQSFIGSRSFGTTPELVSSMGLSLAKGLEDKGVIPVYKHFPGHGGTTTDSHYDLPVIDKTKEELLSNDLIPFKDAIKEGAEVIMIGHLAIPKIDGNTPASLSKVLITDLLKEELGFKGLVVTDALNMGALTKNYKESEIYEMAINAGVDLLLMPATSTSAITTIKDLVQQGKIKEEQIDNSVRKILKLKYEKLAKDEMLDKSFLASSEHKEIISKIK